MIHETHSCKFSQSDTLKRDAQPQEDVFPHILSVLRAERTLILCRWNILEHTAESIFLLFHPNNGMQWVSSGHGVNEALPLS